LNRDWSVAGASRAVTRIQRALSGLHWTADGKALLYSSGSAAANYLWRIDAGGGEASRLEVAGSLAFDPAVARRGNRAAYRQFVGNLDVWRMDARGASRPLIASSYLDDSGRYSPDGTRIVFSTQRGLESRELWLANADGSEQTPLTHGPGIHQGSPCWSPDGKWIAFDSQDGTTAVWQIWKIEAAGGVPRRVTSLPAGANVPFWSRDGRTIYFNSLHQGRKEIFRIPAAGGTPEQVTRAGGVVVQESPDGRISYYTKSRDDSPLYAMPTAGGAERQVLPLVSNRGFQVFDDGVYYQISSDGKTEVRFREFAGGNERVIGSVDSAMDIYLSVSPDRSWILFTYSPNTGSNLMLIENFR
jgi:Tol biopolymer transport system component